MPDLTFRVEGAQPQRSAAIPQLLFRLWIGEATSTPIHSVLLRCQVRIEPARRRYEPREQEKLIDLFGTPDRWGQTVRDMSWVHVTVTVPPFVGETTVDLPCGPDSAPTATRYFDALETGDVPLSFLFSGSVFYEAAEVGLQVAPIPWDKEAGFRLTVAVWKDLFEEPATP